MPPKFRLFGGPNGSGKTFVYERLRTSGTISTEMYINADRILRDIRKKGRFNFNAYRVRSDEAGFRKHVLKSGLLGREEVKGFLDQIELTGGILNFRVPAEQVNAYHASFISSYLAEQVFASGQSFCFETVMSHVSKLAMFDMARKNGYKSYLYFVFTDNPELNISRVKIRAAGGLHDVENGKILSRYKRSFGLLAAALHKGDEAFLINNSEQPQVVVQKKAKKIARVPGTELPAVLQAEIGGLIE